MESAVGQIKNMIIDELIQEKFKKQIVTVKAGELLFKHTDVLKVIDELERLHAVILGLDFWQQCDDGDVMEINSTNWASINIGKNASKDTIEAARELLKDDLPDDADYASFVLRDQEVEL